MKKNAWLFLCEIQGFLAKKIYFFLHHSDGGGEAPYKLFQNKEVQLDEMFH